MVRKKWLLISFCLLAWAIILCQGVAYLRWHAKVPNDYKFAFQMLLALVLLWIVIPVRRLLELRSDIRDDIQSYVGILAAIVTGIFGIVSIGIPAGLLLGAVLTALGILAITVRHDRFRQDTLLHGKSTIQSFSTWDDRFLRDTVSNAKKSIEVIDSNCSEWHFLSVRAREAVEGGADNLVVSVYMLDPKQKFGAQREIEKQPFLQRAATRPEGFYQNQYQHKYEENVRDIRDAIEMVKLPSGKPVDVHFYTYPTMPCLRVIIVDDSQFIFGWFPLGALNPNHPCFFLSASSILTKSDERVLFYLKNQINEIKQEATPDTTTGLSSAAQSA